MFLTFCIVFSLLVFFTWAKLNSLEKHDETLNRFCNLRRKMMQYLRDNYENISKNDYHNLRKSLDLLNNNIHYFDIYKTHIFNLSFLMGIFKAAKENLNEVNKLQDVNNQEIKSLISSFEKAFLIAFFRFTPWLKTRLCIGFFVFMLSLIGRASQSLSRKTASKVNNAISTIQMIEDRKISYSM